MTDMDADLIRLRNWQAGIEARLAALEARGGGGSSGAPDAADLLGVRDAITSLRASITDVEAQLAAVKVQANDTSAVLAGVETALGSHSHPPSPSAESPPVASAAPAGG